MTPTILNTYSARISSSGQVTIPKKIRERLGVHLHDEIVFV